MFAAFNSAANWWQVALILAVVITAWATTRTFGRVLTKGRSGMRPLLSRQNQRVIFPLLALVLLLAASSLLQLLQEPVNLVRIAGILLATLAGLRLLFSSMRKHFAPTPTFNVWVKLISSGTWLAVFLYLTELLPPLVEFLDRIALSVGETRISLLSAINFLLLTAALFTIAIWISSYLERRLKESEHVSISIRIALVKVIRILLVAVAVIIALDAAGIGLTTLTVVGGAIGVGIGFGLQRTASNFITGFLLLFDRSIRPHDIIKVGDRFGVVQELRARYIVLKDFDGVSILIPNEQLITGEVVNWSFGEHTIRIRIPVDISYDDDPVKALQLLLAIGKAHPRTLANPPPEALLLSFGDNGLKLELYVWIDDPENGMANIKSEINRSIWREFRDNHIHFPYPQHDIHVKELPANVTITPSK